MKMDLNRMINQLKSGKNSTQIGMIASHLGIVRGHSRKGNKVNSIEVHYNQETLYHILDETKKMPGIVDILVETTEGRLKVGEEILAIAVAGDIREHVFPALIRLVDRIKSEAVTKKER